MTTTERLQQDLDDARYERMLAARAMSAAKDTGDEVQIDMAGTALYEADRHVRKATRALDLHMGVSPYRRRDLGYAHPAAVRMMSR